MDQVGKLLILTGIVVSLFGLVFLLMGRGVIPRLPGTVVFGRGNVRVFVPLGASILISVVLTIVLNAFFRH